jgi:hypothetical protein
MDGKRILAIIAGLVVSMLALYTVKTIMIQIYPVDLLEIKPAMKSRELFGAYLERQPIGSILSEAIAHAIGMFVGLYLAYFIDPRGRGTIIILASIIIMTNVINLISIPYPLWFPMVDVVMSVFVASMFIMSKKKA